MGGLLGSSSTTTTTAPLRPPYSTLLSTAPGLDHASSGTPTRTMRRTEALRARGNDRTRVQVIQKSSLSHMWGTKSFYVTFTQSVPSRTAAPVRSHRLNPRTATAAPRAVQGAEMWARLGDGLDVDLAGGLTWRLHALRAGTSSGKVWQQFVFSAGRNERRYNL